MIFSVALILFFGMTAGELCRKIRVPSLFGMILTGIFLGPSMLDLMDSSILDISIPLRKIALVVILLRAGLKLNLSDLKKNGRSAVLMCFVPAVFEITGMIILAPLFLNISRLDAAILGAVVAAVSPAVVVPKMLKLMDEKRGTAEGIPQMILAGASVDDVFVIVMFTTFTSLAGGEGISLWRFASIPVSILTGCLAGFFAGIMLCTFWKKIHIRDTSKIILLLCLSFFMIIAEEKFSRIIPFASLIGVMAGGLAIKMKNREVASRLSEKLNRLWVPAEIFLFVLVGASVKIESVAGNAGIIIVLLILVIAVRMAGVFVCVAGTELCFKEKLFCAAAYVPKATVQAAIGGIPLAMGLGCGEIVLSVSVMAILITAPLGAFFIDLTYKKFLKQEDNGTGTGS